MRPIYQQMGLIPGGAGDLVAGEAVSKKLLLHTLNPLKDRTGNTRIRRIG